MKDEAEWAAGEGGPPSPEEQAAAERLARALEGETGAAAQAEDAELIGLLAEARGGVAPPAGAWARIARAPEAQRLARVRSWRLGVAAAAMAAAALLAVGAWWVERAAEPPVAAPLSEVQALGAALAAAEAPSSARLAAFGRLAGGERARALAELRRGR